VVGGKVYVAGLFEDAPPVADVVGFIKDAIYPAGDGAPFVLEDGPGFQSSGTELFFAGCLGTGGGV